MKKLILTSLLTAFVSTSFADHVTEVDTKSWKNIPITVDVEKNTYTTAEGIVVPADNFYYSYEGHRCYKDKRDGMADMKILKSSTGDEIYCYTE